MYIIWKYNIHTKVGNLEWMLRQFNWSLHMSKQVWHVGAYQEKNSILYYLSKIKQFIWSDLDVRIMIGNYLAQLSSFLRVVWWVPALLEAISGSRLVEVILLLSLVISIRSWGELPLTLFLWDSELRRQWRRQRGLCSTPRIGCSCKTRPSCKAPFKR